MRSVKRTKKPPSLKNNATRWTTDLLAEITRCQILDEIVEDRYYNKYRTESVKSSLDKMYDNYCCYCEVPVGLIDYPHIEHRKPKRQKKGIPLTPFPELTYEWTNLHLSCGKCNIKKGNKYNDLEEILDASTDTDISTHFSYRAVAGGVYWLPETPRGETTENHVKLNRTRLFEDRLPLWVDVTETITNINRTPNNRKKEIAIRELKKKANEIYGSMVKYLIDSLLK